jgi:radical SAM superfamily enzyme YgiQ (UPF0313 family)
MKVGLVQINNSFSGQSYLPYSLGLLVAYLKQHSKKPFDFGLPIYSRVKVDEAVEKLLDKDIVLFSLYVWNARISLQIAERLKEKNPNVKLIFGGPQVPDKPDQFYQQNKFIDFLVHGEGESTLHQLIESDFAKNIAGTSYIENGKVITHPKPPRIKDINVIPSPYLSGFFDDLIKAYPQQKWIACWETNRGCPFSCTYCDWGSNTVAKVTHFAVDRLKEEINWFSSKQIDYVFCCDANFGIVPRDVEIAQYVAGVKAKTDFPKRLSVQNTKNATERSYLVQKILSDSGLNKGVTLSMQSVDKTTLENVKRANISLASYQELQNRFTKDGVETYTDLILGLPGETYSSFVNGINTIILNGQHNRIQFNNLSILPNAEMAKPEYIEKHGLITIESNIVNMHGSLEDTENEILERQQLVIATKTTPHADWVKTRTICWIVNFYYFNKIFQIPMLITNKLTGLDYKVMFEALVDHPKLEAFPTLKKISDYFLEKAHSIQNGGEEYVLSKKYLNIFWPADELMLINLVFDNEIKQFYSEATVFLKTILGPEYKDIFPIIDEAARLNQSLLKTPFQTENLNISFKYDIYNYYQGLLINQDTQLEEKETRLTIDRTKESWRTIEDYCREVVWYGNKKGAYLYGNPTFDERLGGIH